MPQTAKVFQSGNSQAVRIPAEFRFDTDEVFIRRTSDGEVVLSPRPRPRVTWESFRRERDKLLGSPELESFMVDRDQPELEDRDPLAGMAETRRSE